VFEIKDLLMSLFVSSIIPLCPRLCNCAAHALAAQGCNSPQNSISRWDGMAPGVEDIVTIGIADSFS
jgi:hypothetical protein